MNYQKTQTDLPTFLHLDHLWSPQTTTAERLAALRTPSWQVQQAALWTLAAHPDLAALPAIEQLLDEQDNTDLYGTPDHWDYHHPQTAVEEAWRCRYRVKQAACYALASIGATAGPATLGANLIARLEHYATSQTDDYAVRAEACRALGKLRLPSSRQALRQASGDGEWCTATEARKALASLP